MESADGHVRAPLELEAEANAFTAARMRRILTAWLALDGTGELVTNLVLAGYEAIANVAEHAYTDHPDGVGPVRVRAHRHPDAIVVTIADDGTWDTTPSGTHRGRGLLLIRHLIPDTHIETTPTGTVIHLRVPWPRRHVR